MENKVRLELTHNGQVARITLTAPKANILDKAMMLGLGAACEPGGRCGTGQQNLSQRRH